MYCQNFVVIYTSFDYCFIFTKVILFLSIIQTLSHNKQKHLLRNVLIIHFPISKHNESLNEYKYEKDKMYQLNFKVIMKQRKYYEKINHFKEIITEILIHKLHVVCDSCIM